MITSTRIYIIQNKIRQAILKIEQEENVRIAFSSINYNNAYYTTKMKVSTTEKSEVVDSVYLSLSKKMGFTQNIIGMKFEGRKGIYKIVDIKPRNTKYPIIAEAPDGKQFKFSSVIVKNRMGGDKIINRNANLDKLFD